MEVEVKIENFYLYTADKGWMYILSNNYFLPGDKLTDGENVYTIKKDSEIKPDPTFHWPVPYVDNENIGYLYCFTESIPDYRDKILTLSKY